MTLKEAIEINNRIAIHKLTVQYPSQIHAVQLGSEALKWRALMERDYGSWCGPLLPGETKD